MKLHSKIQLKILALVLISLCFVQLTSAETCTLKTSRLPVDVSFLVVDLKFHPVRGAQICEIQHGVPSGFSGESFANGGTSYIAQNFFKIMNGFYSKSWVEVEAFSDLTLRAGFSRNIRWTSIKNVEDLETKRRFLTSAALPVDDPMDLSSYHGFVILRPRKTDDRESFRNKYPGVVVVDNATYMYRRDKLMMTELLMGNPLTEKHKPKWGIYSREFQPGLADRIKQDIGSDILVIKPLDAFKGYGIIILNKEDLELALEYIFKREDGLAANTLPSNDKEYQYWLSATTDYFIVEEFIESDPVKVPSLGGKLFSPTLRLAFLLFYNKGTIEVICLGGYDKYPKKAVTDKGTLTERFKTCGEFPYFGKTDPKIMKKAGAQVGEVLKIIYQKMLGVE